MNIVGNRKIFLSISIILILASTAAVAVFGFRQSIDFAGGTFWQIKFIDQNVAGEALENLIKSKFDLKGFGLSVESSTQSFLIRSKEISEEDHQKYSEFLTKEFGKVEELRFESIGSSIGQELRQKAIWAAGLVLLIISLYLAFAFRKVSYLIQSWKYSAAALLILFHDIIIPLGVFAFLGWWRGVEVGATFIVAILVILGYSINDAITVFDRIREKIIVERGKKLEFSELVNRGVNESIVRCVNTSLTTASGLLAIYFLGPDSLSYFTLAILIGIIVGTYSAIFIAGSLLVVFKGKN